MLFVLLIIYVKYACKLLSYQCVLLLMHIKQAWSLVMQTISFTLLPHSHLDLFYFNVIFFL